MFRAGNEVESIYNLKKELENEILSEETDSSINEDSNLIENNSIYK